MRVVFMDGNHHVQHTASRMDERNVAEGLKTNYLCLEPSTPLNIQVDWATEACKTLVDQRTSNQTADLDTHGLHRAHRAFARA